MDVAVIEVKAGAFRVLVKGGPSGELVQSVKEASLASREAPA